MTKEEHAGRHLGLLGATGVGVGAIVGGGILALAGAAFAATGPSAVLAFALNGVIALLTALSFAEIASKFPQSGGTYTFAKKVLTIEAAFTVGWVVWFASIVASVLYALGFGQFAAVVVADVWRSFGGEPPAWLTGFWGVTGLAVAATIFYTLMLCWKSSGGGQLANLGKVLVFAVLIAGGLWAMCGRSAPSLGRALTPFFAEGAAGLFQAMGFTFIALQGFDLIAAVGGEVRHPERTIPRAMLGSLGIALLIYIPLLLVIATVGMAPEQSVTEVSRAAPDTLVAAAAEQYLGSFGYWLVLVAAVLSMLSALQANLLAASRVAMTMAGDRTLPRALSKLSSRKTPQTAILLTSLIVMAVVIVLPDVSAAGAAASLIFLITFALAHWIAVLVRQRSVSRPPPFRSPLFPLVPVLGGAACVALAIYQGVAVRSAGVITVVWLAAGGLLFLALFARRARIADASSAALDPEVMQLRGRSPLVLVPVANPATAEGLMEVAAAMAPPEVGRVLVLSVVVAPPNWRPEENPRPLDDAQAVLREAITSTAASGNIPESLTTVAPDPWPEIARVAEAYRCESVLLGLSRLNEDSDATPLDQVMSRVDCDLVVLRAAKGWRIDQARRILVPVGGRGGHELLLARLLASLWRRGTRDVTFLRILPASASAADQRAARQALRRLAVDVWPEQPQFEIVLSDAPGEEVARCAAECDLVVLGVQRVHRRQKVFGKFTLQLAATTSTPLLLLSRRG
ncbi:MAG: amino acid permease [Pirellulaceae bacterium]